MANIALVDLHFGKFKIWSEDVDWVEVSHDGAKRWISQSRT
jgi:hypothetical protein